MGNEDGSLVTAVCKWLKSPLPHDRGSGSARVSKRPPQSSEIGCNAVAFGIAGENGLGLDLQKSQKGFVGQRRRDALSDRSPVGMRPNAQIVAGETGVGQHSPAFIQGKSVKVNHHSTTPAELASRARRQWEPRSLSLAAPVI